MIDRLFFPLLALAALALITLALVWPQGMGRPSPGLFKKPAPVANHAQAPRTTAI